MKKITLNNLKVKIAQDPDNDLCAERYYYFIKSYSRILFSINESQFMDTLIAYLNADDTDKKVIFENHLQGLLLEKDNQNAYIQCFTAISFLENEKIGLPDNVDRNEKMQLLFDNGLTAKQIETEVDFFSKRLSEIEKMKNAKVLITKILQK